MKAFALLSRDSKPELQEVDLAETKSDEVEISIKAASINGFDLLVANGKAWDFMPAEFPVILGRDFAGTITKTGSDIKDISEGDRVAGVVLSSHFGPGTLAESINTKPTSFTKIPQGLDFETAAGLGLAGIAAYDVVEALNIKSGQTILISGATGGVGHVALQLAKLKGATVIATAKPGEAENIMLKIGADHTVDYTKDMVAQVKSIIPNGVDGVIHVAGNPAGIIETIKVDGSLSSTLGAKKEQFDREDITVSAIVAKTTPEKLAELFALAKDGKIELSIGKELTLDKAAEGLEDFTHGVNGKIIVSMR